MPNDLQPLLTQTEAFARSEADAWFRRNSQALGVDPADPVLEMLSEIKLVPRTAVEVGASNGFRLHQIWDMHRTRCVAVEPSGCAIADGRLHYPEVEFRQGWAHQIPIDAVQFELVIVNFVLHWVDRPLLLRSAAEIDRLVRPGGWLIIGDFLPDAPTKVPYHHLPDQGIFTYKQDYGALFTATAMYQEQGRTVFHHSDHARRGSIDSYNRCAVWALQK